MAFITPRLATIVSTFGGCREMVLMCRELLWQLERYQQQMNWNRGRVWRQVAHQRDSVHPEHLHLLVCTGNQRELQSSFRYAASRLSIISQTTIHIRLFHTFACFPNTWRDPEVLAHRLIDSCVGLAPNYATSQPLSPYSRHVLIAFKSGLPRVYHP